MSNCVKNVKRGSNVVLGRGAEMKKGTEERRWMEKRRTQRGQTQDERKEVHND